MYVEVLVCLSMYDFLSFIERMKRVKRVESSLHPLLSLVFLASF